MGAGTSLLLVVVDGLGAGPAPDSHIYGDQEADTIALLTTHGAQLPWELCHGRISTLKPVHLGKGTTTGHWALIGAHSARLAPIHTAFPAELLGAVRDVLGHDPLWAAYHHNGQELVAELGATGERTGRAIVYTSEDAVLQLAGSTKTIPPDTLRRWGHELALQLPQIAPLGRVITRPYASTEVGYTRLREDRRDFHARPLGTTVFDELLASGVEITMAGKAVEIFHWVETANFVRGPFDHDETVDLLRSSASRRDHLLILNVPEVDDLLHDLDAVGAATRLTTVSQAIAQALPDLSEHALLLLTGDHGCDIRVDATANTRELVPLFVAQADRNGHGGNLDDAGRGLLSDEQLAETVTMSDLPGLLRNLLLGRER